MRSEIVEQLKKEIEPLLVEDGLDLVDVLFHRSGSSGRLRILIDRPHPEHPARSGVTVADCETVSRKVGPLLDAMNIFTGRYYLEVSSPGLDRPLRKREDFQRFAGEPVKVRTYGPFEGKKFFQGKLLGMDGDNVRLEVNDREVSIPLEFIVGASLDF